MCKKQKPIWLNLSYGIINFFQSNSILLDWEISNPTQPGQPITFVKSKNQHDSTYHMELLKMKKEKYFDNQYDIYDINHHLITFGDNYEMR